MTGGQSMHTPRRARAVLAVTAGLVVGAITLDPGRQEATSAAELAADTESPTTTTASTTTTTAATTTAPPTTAPPPPSTTTTAPPEATTTAAPTTTTDPPPPPPEEMLRPGDSGQHVHKLQQKLSDLGYWLGEADGTYGQTTQQAVMAFQKAEGLSRDGVAGPETQSRLGTAQRPQARSSSGNLIEVDLARQLMFVVENGQVLHALNTSSGAAGTPTPPGRFTIQREIDGWRHAELGTLYRPKYFNAGIAIHGFPSIPAHPASHGCTRLSNAAMDMLWASGKAEVGTPVWVY